MIKTLHLFCLPFAGGNRYSYREFELCAPSYLKVVPLEYPGRGSRIGEALVSDINLLVDDLYAQVQSQVVRSDYAIYGHSMGGLLAYLLARRVLEKKHPPPLHMFITGTTGPSAVSRRERPRHLMDKKEFIEEIKKLDGSPDEILENEELLEYLEPILRSDFKATESYRYQDLGPLDLPFTVITGTEEPMAEEDIQLWQKESLNVVDFRRMTGKHFFIYKYAREIIDLVTAKLLAPAKIYQL